MFPVEGFVPSVHVDPQFAPTGGISGLVDYSQVLTVWGRDCVDDLHGRGGVASQAIEERIR